MSASSTDEREGLVTQLAALLCQASRLAGLVNSDQFTDAHRERLRELVGHLDYRELTTNLGQMATGRRRRRTRGTGRTDHERR